jgi:hypothetical protein
MCHEEITFALKRERPVLEGEAQDRDDGIRRTRHKGDRPDERKRLGRSKTPKPLIEGGRVDQLGELIGRGSSAATTSTTTSSPRMTLPPSELPGPAGLQVGGRLVLADEGRQAPG